MAPLQVEIYHDGLVRMCTERYETPTPENVSRTKVHLANWSLNKVKENPLPCAAAKGKTPIMKLLLEMGAWRLCDSQSDEGWTPLHHAAFMGHADAVPR